MDTPAFVKLVLDRNQVWIERALNGVPEELLIKQVHPDANSMAWLLWHLSRMQDQYIAGQAGKEQVWVSEGWHTRFSRTPNPADTGQRETPDQVRTFSLPDVQTLMGYYMAARGQTDRFLEALSSADMDRPVEGMRPGDTMPLATRMTMLLIDNIQHVGQMAYVRGLLQGYGWLAV